MTAADITASINLPPKQAVAFLRSKGYAITENWWDLWGQAQAHAKTIVGESRKDLIADVFTTLEKRMEAGGSSQIIAKDIAQALADKGWYYGKSGGAVQDGDLKSSIRRLKLITKQNSQTAYMAGRWQRYQANKKRRPFLQYFAVIDPVTRDSHRALHGRVFHIDDPIWDIIMPPNGFHCRCRIRALSQADMDEMGVKVSRSVIHKSTLDVGIDKSTGEIIKKPVYQVGAVGGRRMMHIDPGFDYNAGKSRYQPFIPQPGEINAHNVHLTGRLADADKLLPDNLSPEDYALAFLSRFGIDELDGGTIFTDATGLAIPINKQLLTDKRKGELKSAKRGRGRFLPLLADAITQPDEIWLDWELREQKSKKTKQTTRRWTLKRRYIRVIDLGDELFALSVVTQKDGQWYGSTVFQIDQDKTLEEKLKYINDQRTGVRIYTYDPQNNNAE